MGSAGCGKRVSHAICACQPRKLLLKLAKSNTAAVEDETALEVKDAVGYPAAWTAAYEESQDVAVSVELV